jgi:PIN domain nuclease of toxin-antitoxin system
VRVLLDTHALYWYIEGDSQLSTTACTLIQDASNEVLISPASYWEIAIKISLGKWQLNPPYADFIDIGLKHYGFLILPTCLSGWLRRTLWVVRDGAAPEGRGATATRPYHYP